MKTQAWGWLAAGVLALGLNGIYQDGGAAWLHRNFDQAIAQVANRSESVLALATGRADWFLAKTNRAAQRNEMTSCRVANAVARAQTKLARVQSKVAWAQGGMADFEAMSARHEAALAQLEANRAQMEAQLEQVRFSPVAFDGEKIRTICPRVRVHVSRMPRINMPAPEVHVETMSPEPI